jgi:NAD(P)-dependent dehydrogenase (short-subunit alcohol dehydrogenase family)
LICVHQRGTHVVATVRGSSPTALHDLRETAGERLEIERLDITAPEQAEALRDRLQGRTFDLGKSVPW